MESIPSEQSVAVPAGGMPAAHTRWGAGERRHDAPVRARLELQARAPGNLRRHAVRAVRRVLALLVADLASFWVMRELMRVVRDDAVVGQFVARSVSDVLPQGLFVGWQYAIALAISLIIFGNYREGDARHDPRRLFLACALATALPLWGLAWVRGVAVVAGEYSLTVALVWCGLFLERSVVDRIAAVFAPPELHATRTLFVGPGEECEAIASGPAFNGGGEFRAVGFVDTHSPAASQALGQVADFERILHMRRIEAVVICGYLADSHFRDVVDAALAAGCQVMSVPRAVDVARVQPTLVWRRGQALVHLAAPTLTAWQFAVKRMVDIAGAVACLVVGAPLFAAIAAWIKLESPGPVFFGQRRLGRNGVAFRCFKFRSMHQDAEARLRSDEALYAEYVAHNYKLPEDRDPRITRVGRFLRKTSLDELPQLFNVLRGDMSLVGPRPIVPEELREYGRGAPMFLSLKPGMTGAWQVSGRSSVGYPDRAGIELEYARMWSLAGDLSILLRTLPAVLARRGAH